ncbi:MAG: helix-turn-helix transcriptional regulator, partial [Candidatus Eisenbacteria sp.]|nr:helix-turn-helix transcriptional regulator [Candidatus Eisenbacteria bacterium]
MARRKKTLIIRSARQVRALRTPLRQEIVQALTKLGACTVRELADELGHEPAALYYHVHALEEAGIAVETDKRRGGGRPEGIYELVA